jgi:hypothetical protein
MVRAAAVLATLALVMTSCGGGKPVPASEAAAHVVTDFAKAFGTGDGQKACDLLTPAARSTFLKKSHAVAPTTDCVAAMKRVHDLAGASVTGAFTTATVSGVKVTGATATATLTANGHSAPVYLARQGGDWKLTGVPGI